MRILGIILSNCLLLSGVISAHSASVKVSPVNIELAAGQNSTSLKLSNDENALVAVQVRIFKWVQQNGQDVLTPTQDVSVSPPFIKMKPKSENAVRIVRTGKSPRGGEDSYRVVIDEIPSAESLKANQVSFVVRQVLPLFFQGQNAPKGAVDWSAKTQGNGLAITAANSGGRHLKVIDLNIIQKNQTIGSKKGLVGYVLNDSSATWNVPTKGKISKGSVVELSLKSDREPINVQVKVD